MAPEAVARLAMGLDSSGIVCGSGWGIIFVINQQMAQNVVVRGRGANAVAFARLSG